jgi:glycogen phosphorylase
LGDGQEHGDDPVWNSIEAEALYSLLEREVVPEFYARDENGIPVAWVARMRESMARLTPRFSASRAVREYTDEHYLPAAAAYRERTANNGALGRHVVEWRQDLELKWASMRFGEVKVETNVNRYVFEVQLYPGEVDLNSVRVQLCADGTNGGAPVREDMQRLRDVVDAAGAYRYSTQVPAVRPSGDYACELYRIFTERRFRLKSRTSCGSAERGGQHVMSM